MFSKTTYTITHNEEITKFTNRKSFPKRQTQMKHRQNFANTKNIRPRTKISARGLMLQYKKENIYRDFIFASISSTANSTALSTSICSSMVRQACNTVE